MAHLLISLFGSFKVALAGQPVTRFESDKVRALLAYLAVEFDRPHRRETLAGLLWSDRPEQAARHNLSQSLLRLRQAIGDRETTPPFLIITRQTIQFNPTSDYRLDVSAFLTYLKADPHLPVDHPLTSQEIIPPDIQALRQAAKLYQGDFLAHFFLADNTSFEEWALSKREQLRRHAMETLDRLAEYYEQRAEYELAHHYAWRRRELDPFQEEAHRRLMRLLALSGQRSAALTQYQLCRQILAEEFGIEPATETTTLYEQIRDGEIGQPGNKKTLAREQSNQEDSPTSSPHLDYADWGEAADLDVFYGRESDLAILQEWLVTDRCRLVGVFGIGGTGKTALVTRLAKSLAEQSSGGRFEYIIWRSLLNAPPLVNILRGCLQVLSPQQVTNLPPNLDEQLALLFDYLRQYRCLLILDNVENVMQKGDRVGHYKPGYEDYGQLIRRVGESGHQSCLLLTGQEKPNEFAHLDRANRPVRSHHLAGLDKLAGQAILAEQALTGSTALKEKLVRRYSGNPLALILVSQTIRDLFGGDIAAFLSQETPLFGDIRAVLDQQFARLSPFEQAIMVGLAIEREPISAQDLWHNLVDPGTKRVFPETLRSLHQRSLLEKRGNRFTLQDVIIEYTTDRLVEWVIEEILTGKLCFLIGHTLLRVQAKEHIRQSQTRLILQPIIEQLTMHLGQAGLEKRLQELLGNLQAKAYPARGYTRDNILTLLSCLRSD